MRDHLRGQSRTVVEDKRKKKQLTSGADLLWKELFSWGFIKVVGQLQVQVMPKASGLFSIELLRSLCGGIVVILHLVSLKSSEVEEIPRDPFLVLPHDSITYVLLVTSLRACTGKKDLALGNR